MNALEIRKREAKVFIL